jgi:hypothetical protein
MLSVILLSVVILRVVMLSVIVISLTVVMLGIIILNVKGVIVPFIHALHTVHFTNIFGAKSERLLCRKI